MEVADRARVIAGDRRSRRFLEEEYVQQRTAVPHRKRQIDLAGRARQLRREPLALLGHLVDSRLRQLTERHGAGSAGDRIAVESTRVKNRSAIARIERRHDFLAAADGADREAAADDLAEHRQVGTNLENLLPA